MKRILWLPLPPQFCSMLVAPSPPVPRPEQASLDAVHQRPARGGLLPLPPNQFSQMICFWSVQFCDVCCVCVCVCCLFILWDVACLRFEALILDGSQFSGFYRIQFRSFISLLLGTHNIWSIHALMFFVIYLAQVTALCVSKMGEDEETRPCWATRKWAFQMLM